MCGAPAIDSFLPVTFAFTPRPIETLRHGPLKGPTLAAVVLLVWLGGALYCSGYEALSSGFDNWPGSLVWSAYAVLPWLALFEWSKHDQGRSIVAHPLNLVALLMATAILSLALEAAVALITGERMTPLGLAMLRRLPAAGMSLILILWARPQSVAPEIPTLDSDSDLPSLAATIDWIAAADNYVELHIGDRTSMRRMKLSEAEALLAPSGFVRIHRRFLVNGARIAEVRGNGDRFVRLVDGVELPVGRRFSANLPAL